MKCPQCQAEVGENSKFCPYCGVAMGRATGSAAGPPDVSGEGGGFNVSQAPREPAGGTGQRAGLNGGGLPAQGAGPSTHRFKTGEVILGRYRVTGELGQGGMGVVYKCFDQVGGIEVALKALPPELSHNSVEMALVRENFQMVERLHHPNIAAVKTLEKDNETGDCFLIMECVEGMDLWRWLQRVGGRASLAETQAVLWHVAQALDYAHSQKIIHRDIKPANVIIRQDGAVKVLDFGLAAQIQTSLARVSQAKQGTSGTGPYMAPEQWRGQYQDAATDQYALAVLAYELLTGRPPFEGQDVAVLREAVLREEPARVKELDGKGWRALRRGLAKGREERYGSCGELVEALRGGRRQKAEGRRQGVEGSKSEAWNRRWGIRTSAAVAAGAIALVLLSWAGWQWARRLRPSGSQSAEAGGRDKPYVNSLGMKFVPVPGTKVLFSVWDTRVKDYTAYAAASSGVDGSWRSPGFEQGDTHPVVNVSWRDAQAFCRWLTEKERKAGLIPQEQSYRLPTDAEWSVAVGLNEESGGTPKDKDEKIKDVYPWGTEWPPPSGAGNYDSGLGVDSYENTSPAGSFSANRFGLYDMGGNVWQWCEDFYDGPSGNHVVRGASWYDDKPNCLLSSYRFPHTPENRDDSIGFRCVLVMPDRWQHLR